MGPESPEPASTEAPVAARPAATVIVARPSAGAGGGAPEILLLKRARAMTFFPNAWVFPGGRVDSADGDLPVVTGRQPLSELQRSFVVAAVRECFEETGVWLGDGVATAQLRSRLVAGDAKLSDGTGLSARVDRLRLWSWWVTPEQETRRYDTRFFLAVVPRAQTLGAGPDGVETVDMTWLTAGQALLDTAAGRLSLAPPTFRTLEELSAYGSVDDLWAAAGRRQVHPIQPVLLGDVPGTDGVVIVLPGDPLYPDPQPDRPAVSGGTRIVLRGGRWVSEDAGPQLSC